MKMIGLKFGKQKCRTVVDVAPGAIADGPGVPVAKFFGYTVLRIASRSIFSVHNLYSDYSRFVH